MKTLIIILTKLVTAKMYSIYSRFFRKLPFIIITDYKSYIDYPNIFTFNDDTLFEQFFTNLSHTKDINAWDKMLYYLSKYNKYDFYWIIQDNIALSNNIEGFIFSNNKEKQDLLFFSNYKQQIDIPNDKIWDDYKKYFFLNELSHSYNFFSRISKELVYKIISFKNEHNKFINNQILFLSIVKKYDLSFKNIIHKQVIINNTDNSINHQELSPHIFHPIPYWYDHIL